MNENEHRLSEEAIRYVKARAKELIEKFASDSIFPSDSDPVSIFMAGSPGAGKTEFSKRLVEALHKSGFERSLRRNRLVWIIYIYQDPLVAWRFTKVREKLEGRYIPKEGFVRELFQARQNVRKVKELFEDKVRLCVVTKNFKVGSEEINLNVAHIDDYGTIEYSKDKLNELLI